MNPTDAVVVAALVLLLIWEGWTLGNKRRGDTISESIWRAVLKQPLVPFLLGLLMGHWLWLPSKCWEAMR